MLKSHTNILHPISPENAPNGSAAKRINNRVYTGKISYSSFGYDPLHENPELKQQRETEFKARFDVGQIFQELCNSSMQSFKNVILHYINPTTQLSLTL